jgi:hypothetical protein
VTLRELVDAQALLCRQYAGALRELRSGLITEGEFEAYCSMLRGRALLIRMDEETTRLAFGSDDIRARAYLPNVLARGLQSSIHAVHSVFIAARSPETSEARKDVSQQHPSNLPMMLAGSLMGQRRGKP